jgi:hypothetical protein
MLAVTALKINAKPNYMPSDLMHVFFFISFVIMLSVGPYSHMN